jgi:transcription initiation factor TFIID subunit TAF12
MNMINITPVLLMKKVKLRESNLVRRLRQEAQEAEAERL